jgi:ABC-2 type transport system ATP-binding protein
MITISNLKKQFGETIASDIASFTINDGDILGLVGNNGAGKSTLFRIMLDLLKPDAGSVCYTFPTLGVSINPAESEEWKWQVGAYLDEGFLIDFLTPEEYFAFLGKVSGKTQAEVDERLKDFERLSADEIFGHKKLIRNLSAGNKQKVGIISALFNKPNTIILDEPFNGLDKDGVKEMREYLLSYKEQGKTILICSHSAEDISVLCETVHEMDKGMIEKLQ